MPDWNTTMRPRHRTRFSKLILVFTVFAAAASMETVVSAQTPASALVWDFESDNLQTVGGVRWTAGPRDPEFAGFAATNQAIKLDGRGSHVVYDPPASGPGSLQFTDSDAITLAAWIAPLRSGENGHRYVIGKGRTGNKGFRRDNQNWALRLTKTGDGLAISFLFATPGKTSGVSWHRWTSDQLVATGDGWHHVAVSYRFGQPETIRGWIDGKRCQGTWDMDGPTREAPIVDTDQVWIGSSMGGSHANSFRGALDGVSVERCLLTDQQVATRYRRDPSIPRKTNFGEAAMPNYDVLPAGQVFHEILAGAPSNAFWPDPEDIADMRSSVDDQPAHWTTDSFLIPRLPQKYDDWGIRSAWKAPLLYRIAADVELPVGKQRLMLRARSLGRLWIDGKQVLATKPMLANAPSGEEPIQPLATPPHPGMRVKDYRQQEVFAIYDIVPSPESPEASRRVCRVVLELIVGGPKRRTEIGETCVAIETQDKQSFDVLIPFGSDLKRSERQHRSLLEPTASRLIDSTEKQLHRWETEVRRDLASSQDDYWAMRRRQASQWAAENPAPAVPTSNSKATHPIDAFILDRIDQARHELAKVDGPDPAENHFRNQVLPLLQTHCFRCHGKAEKGGLRLDSRESAVSEGESGWAAIVPGKPDESELILRLESVDPSTRMPLGGQPLAEREIGVITDWIRDGAVWPEPNVDPKLLQTTPLVSDAAFLRRISLDTIGVPPTSDEVREFLADESGDKRSKWIDRRLQDDRVADHLVADWLDLLAENPTLLNTSLNSTGPFRFFLYESLLDRKPIDRMVTELVLMKGDRHTGGSAGFGVAGENDSPMAAKAHIIASGLLGVEMQCARCHDSPFHRTTQEDLFSLAAMLNRKPLSVPATSRVPDAFFEEQQREPMIEVTLASGKRVTPTWSLASQTGVSDDGTIDELLRNPTDSRERLAALITTPQNTRFPAVIVNRVWTRLMGEGLVPSLHDWEHHQPVHSELLTWLSHEFVTSGYDIRRLMRLIMTSDAYARRAVDSKDDTPAKHRFFAAPATRRLTAEQVVDSMFAASGREMESDELTFVHDGRRQLSNRQTLGEPTRAWMFATLNNERDRPSLSLPRARAIVDVLQAFGWNGSRQKPVHQRESSSNVLQPGVLANGVLSASLSRAANRSRLAELAVQSTSAEQLVDEIYLRFLSRYPSEQESQFLTAQLDRGFNDRLVPADQQTKPTAPPPLPLIHWFNHLRPRANEIQQEIERRVRQGPPNDPRLRDEWRERYEDVIWSLINHDEFVWIP